MALHELQFSTLNSPVTELARKAMPEDEDRAFGGKVHLDLNPPYQRASVWTTEQRVNLIKSLLQGLPIGAVFVNERPYPEPWAVVDGKQRIETIVMWLRGDLAVPKSWFEDVDLLPYLSDDVDVVVVSNLSVRGRRRTENHWSIAQYRTRIPAEMERELYARINYGGTPHEPLEG